MSICGLGISCEPVSCEHGRQLRIERCYICELNDQIFKLNDISKSLSIRIEALHEFKLRQIDENRKISRRVDEFEKIFNELKYVFKERI